jgi:hypothetical protein
MWIRSGPENDSSIKSRRLFDMGYDGRTGLTDNGHNGYCTWDLCPPFRTISRCYLQLDKKVIALQIICQQIISDFLVGTAGLGFRSSITIWLSKETGDKEMSPPRHLCNGLASRTAFTFP